MERTGKMAGQGAGPREANAEAHRVVERLRQIRDLKPGKDSPPVVLDDGRVLTLKLGSRGRRRGVVRVVIETEK